MKPFPPIEDVERLKELYASGISLGEIGKAFGCGTGIITRELKANNIPERPKGVIITFQCPFCPTVIEQRGGQVYRSCGSMECKFKLNSQLAKERAKGRVKPPILPRDCASCGKPFTPDRDERKTCSGKCINDLQVYHSKRMRGDIRSGLTVRLDSTDYAEMTGCE